MTLSKAVLALLLFVAPALQASGDSKFYWNEDWPKFGPSEYVVTGLGLAGSAADYYLIPPPKSAAWRGGILFDRSARNTLMISSTRGRNRANVLSDILTYPLIGYSILDAPISAGWVGGNKEAAFQFGLINAETFAVTEFLNLTISNLIPRSRPEGAACDSNSKYDPHCVKSFWSGHTANVFAAASLVCAEHGAADLYGGKADAVACGTSLAVASSVGFLRIAANDHHASDVIIAALVGAGTGYVMPNLLHFRFKKPSNRLGYLIPHAEPHGGGLLYVNAW